MRKIFALLSMIVALSPFSAVLAQEGAQQFEKFQLQGYTEGGAKAWDVKGDTADVKGSLIDLTNVDANHYGEQDVNLKAKKGQMDKESGNIHLEKDVVITSETGSQLTTDYLDWHKNDDLVTTEAIVTITDAAMTAVGKGLEAHPGLKTAEMKEDVTVTVNTQPKNPDGGQIVTITCDGPMEVDHKNSKATFNKNVVAVETDRILKADIMEIFFDPQSNQIKEAVCTGHVEIIQGGNTTHSDKAVYSGADQKLTLTGRPRLIMLMEGKDAIPAFKK